MRSVLFDISDVYEQITISQLKMTYSGIYVCIASNYVGTAKKIFNMTVKRRLYYFYIV